jgi:peptidoglycan hydrolase FlgJ
MSTISPSVSAIPATTAAPISAARLAQIKKTAQQFEAIFVRQMLAAAHKTSFGETMTSSQGADTFTEMQDSRFADIASQKGAFGLAHMIEKQLLRQQGQNASAPHPAVPAPAAPVPSFPMAGKAG